MDTGGKKRFFFRLLVFSAALSFVGLMIPLSLKAGSGEQSRGGGSNKEGDVSRKTDTGAGEKGESEEEVQRRAREVFQEAEKFYNLAKFKEAMELYEKAYSMMPLPGFLFNIGQCHRMLDNFKKAVFFYEGYLRRGKNIPDEKMVRDLIALCRKKLSEMGEKKQNDGTAETDGSREKGGKDFSASQTGEGDGSEKDLLLGKDVERGSTKSPFYKKWWFWTSIGGGVAAAVITGVVLGLSNRTVRVLPTGDLGRIDVR